MYKGNDYRNYGANSQGMYNSYKKSPLADNPKVSDAHMEAIKDYRDKYYALHGKFPAYTHMNRKYGIRATAKFYMGI